MERFAIASPYVGLGEKL